MHTRFVSAASIAGACGLASPALAGVEQLICTTTFTGQTLLGGPFVSLSPFVSYSNPLLPNPQGFMGNRPLTLLDFAQGNTFNLAGDFPGFTSRATDGLNQFIYLGFVTTTGDAAFSTTTDSTVFTGPNVQGPDLAGWLISRIEIIGSAIQFVQLGPGTAVAASIEFRFYGSPVPAPGAAGVLGLGVFAAVRRRR